MGRYEVSPVIKWAGGKRQLMDEIISGMPKSYNRYYEPFIGGGSVLFSVQPKHGYINDTNKQLINLYRQIKENVSEVIRFVNIFDGQECDKDYYEKTRKKYNQKLAFNEMDAECAALMIWVNKHCFNGLYRVNRSGLFNVPYNNKTVGNSINENNIHQMSEYLSESGTEITCLDFEEACKDAKENDTEPPPINGS